jgi:orotidine-5'-phosphate decarboxylase
MPSPHDALCLPFGERLAHAVRRQRTPLIVGLDPQTHLLPPQLLQGNDRRAVVQATHRFCSRVLEIVAPLVPAVKPQMAFFESLGFEGILILEELARQASSLGLLVILDAKRNDIGSTAHAYASAYLAPRSTEETRPLADAMTVNPYLGPESWEPYTQVGTPFGCGIFVLAKTSNPGGGKFQDLVCDHKPLFEYVANAIQMSSLREVEGGSMRYGSVGAVVGATYPDQLCKLRESMPNCWLLIPGFGAQGGSAADTAGGMHPSGLGAIVNSSRAILYAYREPAYQDKFGAKNWERAVEAATIESIQQLKAATPAGKL